MVDIDNKRKHFIPQMYLRGFSCEGNPNQIYVFDKHRPDQGVQVRSIRDVEVARHAYSVENDKILTEFEAQFSSILHWIRSNKASDLNEYISDRERSSSLRAWLARFVVDITLRSRGFRESAPVRTLIAGFFAEANRQNDELESRIFAQYSDREEEDPQNIVSALRKITHLDDIDKWTAIILDPFVRGQQGAEWYESYQTGSWRFDAAPAQLKFITSDIPSATFRLGPEPKCYNWMWFVVPLSDSLQLMGLLEDASLDTGLAPRLGQWGNREVDMANAAVLQNAQRYIYASSANEIYRTVGLNSWDPPDHTF